MVGIVAQAIARPRWQVDVGEAAECRAAEPAGCGQDRILLLLGNVGAEMKFACTVPPSVAAPLTVAKLAVVGLREIM